LCAVVMDNLRQRNLGLARAAYDVNDEQASRQLSREAHGLLKGEPGSPGAAPSSDGYSWLSLSEAGHNEELSHRGATLIYRGAVDGIIVSVATISLAAAAAWPARMTITVNFVLLACWAAYSACREVLENLTYSSHYKRERNREAWELDNYPEGEIAEMVELYTQKGLSSANARQVVSLMAAAPDFFVDVMMLEELLMAPPPAVTALAAGTRVGGSMAVCGGALPLVALLIHRASLASDAETLAPHTYSGILCLAAAALAYVGTLRAAITHQAKARLAMQTAALALPTVLLAWAAGSMLDGLRA